LIKISAKADANNNTVDILIMALDQGIAAINKIRAPLKTIKG